MHDACMFFIPGPIEITAACDDMEIGAGSHVGRTGKSSFLAYIYIYIYIYICHAYMHLHALLAQDMVLGLVVGEEAVRSVIYAACTRER